MGKLTINPIYLYHNVNRVIIYIYIYIYIYILNEAPTKMRNLHIMVDIS